MERNKILALVLLLLIVGAPVAYVVYGYSSYSRVINPGEPLGSAEYVVVKTPSGQFLSMSFDQFSDYVSKGGNLTEGAVIYKVRVESYITGSPVIDLNTTIRAIYDSFTIVLGDPAVRECSTNPDLYPGSCTLRTAAVVEVTSFVSNVFSTVYYLKGISLGYDNATAREYSYNQTMLRHRKAYLDFWTKFKIGSGRIGNSKNLVVILIGPAEGGTRNAIYVPRKGLVVIEATSDEALRAEVVLIEHLINFQWPSGKSPTQSA
ncbi:MAG: hypothetical protein PWQ79_1002 [Thermococcaceae archaeon]|nr:hypothetical protein [Thermococcaceae archaeon]MDK2914087.1 hypothetical protein [Thermococcaceae archaeon]